MKKSAFTLAEIMIVLTVIGILTGILMPIAFHSAPDEDVMRFKKVYNTFTTAIRELVNSDKYYLDGDLGVKPDGSLVDSQQYFCQTLSDVLNHKKAICIETPFPACSETEGTGAFYNASYTDSEWPLSNADALCDTAKNFAKDSTLEAGIVLDGDILIFDGGPECHFGTMWPSGSSDRLFGNPGAWNAHPDAIPAFVDSIYKIVCIDIDIFGDQPLFAIGVRADGRILPFLRAQEWLEKSVQKGE